MAIWSAISSVKQATRNAYLPAQEQLRVHLEQAGAPYHYFTDEDTSASV
jgi:hypothetical protein